MSSLTAVELSLNKINLLFTVCRLCLFEDNFQTYLLWFCVISFLT